MGRMLGDRCRFQLSDKIPCQEAAATLDNSTETYWCQDHWQISQVQRKHRAYHETGHALAFYNQGLGIKSLSILVTDSEGGAAWPRAEDYPSHIRCYCCLAGQIADELATQAHQLDFLDPSGNSDDLEKARKYAYELVAAEDVASFLDRQSETVRQMLAKSDPEIEALAHLVFDQVNVHGPEAHSVIHGALVDRESGWRTDLDRRCVQISRDPVLVGIDKISNSVTSVEDEWRSGNHGTAWCWVIVTATQFALLQRIPTVEYQRLIDGKVVCRDGIYRFLFRGRSGHPRSDYSAFSSIGRAYSR